MVEGMSFRKEQERREKANFDYLQAMTLGKYISVILTGKGDVPSISDVYPNIFSKEEEKQTSSVNNFIAFAKSFNARFKKQGGE